MTPQEIRNAVDEIAKPFGPEAYVDVQIKAGGHWMGNTLISAQCFPYGVGKDHCIRATGDTFEDALDELRSKIADDQQKIDTATVRKLALKIIELTMDLGECSISALRGAGFDQWKIKRFGAAACEQAGKMAAGAPFVILTANSNNPPVTEAAE